MMNNLSSHHRRNTILREEHVAFEDDVPPPLTSPHRLGSSSPTRRLSISTASASSPPCSPPLRFGPSSFSPSSSSSSSSPSSTGSSYFHPHRDLLSGAASWGGREWERRLRKSSTPKSLSGRTVLVTGAAGFVGFHVSRTLRQRGDGVVGLDNFNDYYDHGLKRDRQNIHSRSGVFVVEGDINDHALLKKLFDVVPFTHVMHLVAQAGVRYAMQNPYSYVHSNIAGFTKLLEACKSANPQPAIISASSSSVYGLNSKVPFSEKDRTDRPDSLYAATKKAAEEIAHAYNHIYGPSITGLRFFTVYGPYGRPHMAYFYFTKDILNGNHNDL
ncbi:hypothetical protein SAY87_016698 [Trapa incisa]|uniref:NAD-dependent epimerase/dehydratase domain-containing protein n=1 Tax=Trapa incisa TaxID=236973 RepID=A0AAN7LI48_9MYRT|nr:hypothetical protein SAY87_016698 [Trapa incisa]